MDYTKYSLFERAKITIHEDMAKREQLGNRLFFIGKKVLSSRILDVQAGTLSQISENAARILDSSWLYFALDSFYCRRNFSIDGCESRPESLVVEIPSNLECVARWSDSISNADGALVKVARGELTPWQDGLIDQVNITKTSRDRGKKLQFLKVAELIISLGVRAKVLRRPKIGILGLHHLVGRNTFGGMMQFLTGGGAIFSEYFPHDETNFPLDVLNRGALKIELMALFNEVRESFTPKMEIDEIQALANYLSIGLPISHFEGRLKNWLAAVDTGSLMADSCSVYTAIGYYYSTYQNFLLGAIKHSGGAIIGVQHGGYYGYMKNMVFHESIEMQCSDRFISWGWDQPPPSERQYETKLVPAGSHYLAELVKNHKARPQAELTVDRVLFCATDFPRRVVRMDSPLTSQFMATNVWPHSVDVMVQWLKKHGKGLDLKPYAGFFSQGAYSEYVTLIKDACNLAGVPLRLLDSRIPARDLMPKYHCVLWDTVGTGFFESIVMNCCTFLTPAASLCPVMIDAQSLTKDFYLDAESEDSFSFDDQFRKAVDFNKNFLQRYGRPAESNFFTFLARQL